MDKAAFLDLTIAIIKRITGEPEFQVLPGVGSWNALSAGWSADAAWGVTTIAASTSRKA